MNKVLPWFRVFPQPTLPRQLGLLIRGFGVRVPGGAPGQKLFFIDDHISYGESGPTSDQFWIFRGPKIDRLRVPAITADSPVCHVE